jgi:uncharacterized protein YkwD
MLKPQDRSIFSNLFALVFFVALLWAMSAPTFATAARKQRSPCVKTQRATRSLACIDKASKAAPPKSADAAQQDVDGAANELLLTIVNEARSSARTCGATPFAAVAPVQWDSRLAAAARDHSEYQASIDSLTHVGAGNSNALQRVERYGVSPRLVGETVAWNYDSPQATLEGWLASEPHCVVVMSPRYTRIGWAKHGAYDTMDLSG